MAKTISNKTIEAITTRCYYGFRFDQQKFLECGEKQLCRRIILKENEKLIKLTLWWRDEVIINKDANGYNVRVYTGNVIPELHCSIWHRRKESPLWVSHGLGAFHPFREHPSPKRQILALADATVHITDELILSLLPEYERAECCQIFNAQIKSNNF